MTTDHQCRSAHEDACELTELVELFARQLAAVRRRLHTLRHRHDALAQIERPLLLEQEIAWQHGIEVLQLAPMLSARRIAEVLLKHAEDGEPGREVYAAMAAMVAIRAAWLCTQQVSLRN